MDLLSKLSSFEKLIFLPELKTADDIFTIFSIDDLNKSFIKDCYDDYCFSDDYGNESSNNSDALLLRNLFLKNKKLFESLNMFSLDGDDDVFIGLLCFKHLLNQDVNEAKKFLQKNGLKYLNQKGSFYDKRFALTLLSNGLEDFFHVDKLQDDNLISLFLDYDFEKYSKKAEVFKGRVIDYLGKIKEYSLGSLFTVLSKKYVFNESQLTEINQMFKNEDVQKQMIYYDFDKIKDVINLDFFDSKSFSELLLVNKDLVENPLLVNYIYQEKCFSDQITLDFVEKNLLNFKESVLKDFVCNVNYIDFSQEEQIIKNLLEGKENKFNTMFFSQILDANKDKSFVLNDLSTIDKLKVIKNFFGNKDALKFKSVLNYIDMPLNEMIYFSDSPKDKRNKPFIQWLSDLMNTQKGNDEKDLIISNYVLEKSLKDPENSKTIKI